MRIPQKLYHATLKTNLDSIKKHGLGGLFKNRLWDYNGSVYKDIKIGVFLETDEIRALDYVANSEYVDELFDKGIDIDETEDIIVFEIKTKDLNLEYLLKMKTL